MVKQNFQIGDSVLTVKNSAWGMKPMTIVKLYGNGASCRNPEFSGTGWFDFDELVKATSKRKARLKKLELMQAEVRKAEKKLFGE